MWRSATISIQILFIFDLSECRDPGKLAHSRWLSCANRILCLYIGRANTTENLKELATFIMKVYVPTWFGIKTKSPCKDGPIHVFYMVKRSLYLRDNLRIICHSQDVEKYVKLVTEASLSVWHPRLGMVLFEPG